MVVDDGLAVVVAAMVGHAADVQLQRAGLVPQHQNVDHAVARARRRRRLHGQALRPPVLGLHVVSDPGRLADHSAGGDDERLLRPIVLVVARAADRPLSVAG